MGAWSGLVGGGRWPQATQSGSSSAGKAGVQRFPLGGSTGRTAKAPRKRSLQVFPWNDRLTAEYNNRGNSKIHSRDYESR